MVVVPCVWTGRLLLRVCNCILSWVLAGFSERPDGSSAQQGAAQSSLPPAAGGRHDAAAAAATAAAAAAAAGLQPAPERDRLPQHGWGFGRARDATGSSPAVSISTKLR